MQVKSQLIAAAVAMVAATGAHAAIDNGNNGNGELFFSIWDANGSYTRSLETSIDSFQTQLGAAGNLNLSWNADSTFTSFLAGANTAALKWNIVALDSSGARRLLTTYTAPEPTTKKSADVIRSAVLDGQGFVGYVNQNLGGGDSAMVNAASNAYAGKVSFKDNFNSKLNFSNAGTLTNNSYATGLGFMRIDAAATGIGASQYNEYLEGTQAVNVWLDAGKTLHIAAVPEPSEYALMLAGLGMLGFIARRRQNHLV